MTSVRGRYDYTVELVFHDAEAVAQYRRDRSTVRAALGGLDHEVEPIGSRLVPGIWSKPIMDLMVRVEEHDLLRAAVLMAAEGFQAITIAELSRTMLRRCRPGTTAPDLHVHLVTPDAWSSSPERAFHRMLHERPAVATAYSAVKHLALELSGGDPQRYGTVKGRFIEWLAEADHP
ncbi:GrpB family protein [Saccharothrix sp. Mg75]|uniref:GrpB family protein n=1 Tax=Saccharothrix sp. Mg75 TaxID=3445357 RepID=UPI003EEC552B